MKNFGIYAGGLAVLAIGIIVSAQMYASSHAFQTLLTFEDNSKIFDAISLWTTLIVAFVTSGMVWIGGRKMHGGVFGSVLNFFSLGMTLVFLGFATEVPWFSGIDHLYLKTIHDSLYIIGYIMMGLAANKLLKVIKGE